MERSFNALPVSQYILDGMYLAVVVLVVMYSVRNMFSQRLLTMEANRVLEDGVNAAALNSTAARQWNQWPMTSIDPGRLMVDQSSIYSCVGHSSGRPMPLSPGRFCLLMNSGKSGDFMVVEREDRDLTVAGFLLLLLGKEDTLGWMELALADQT
jgi:hypothetical protein